MGAGTRAAQLQLLADNHRREIHCPDCKVFGCRVTEFGLVPLMQHMSIFHLCIFPLLTRAFPLKEPSTEGEIKFPFVSRGRAEAKDLPLHTLHTTPSPASCQVDSSPLLNTPLRAIAYFIWKEP